MDTLKAMQVFVAVADAGSQTAAAERLDLSRPVVSRYVAELEAWTGARLLHRTTRKLSLTPAGGETLQRCREVLALSDDMRSAVALPDPTPQGLLRITVSTSFGQMQLAAAVADFVKRHPAVSVDLVMQDRAVNLVEERIDLAVRIASELDPNLIARRLTVCRSVVCAAPAYLAVHPPIRRMADLGVHNCLTHSYYGKTLWHYEQDGEPSSVAVGGNLSANESTSLMQATLAGLGVALLPTFMAVPLLRSGELVAVLPAVCQRELGIYAVYSSRRNMPAALRAMLDFLAERFPPEPPWDRPADACLKDAKARPKPRTPGGKAG
ncbi:LysR family transcriptional regulator [Rhodoferax koreense]|uniref:LysR family transcriptional regulator n=1 Tax=Rhodoferax koreensis TaxID=1842727 RepID=A0A1P8JW41_9BURK|nr:LysR family transcriptional regulator [Rhodoferax koreense]APW37965.1 LysR family transcriptional regulator [Rhodoferax koreense]